VQGEDVVTAHMLAQSGETPVSVPGKAVEGVQLAAVVPVAAVRDGLEPCSAEPILNLHWADCHLPFLRRPLESYRVVCPRSVTSATCPIRFSSVRDGDFPVLSSLLLASSCPPPPLHVASFSLTLQLPAIAGEEQVKVPWAGSMELVQEVVDLVRAGAESWLPVEADHDEVWTWADEKLIW
jgi:hypothetical protein